MLENFNHLYYNHVREKNKNDNVIHVEINSEEWILIKVKEIEL